MYAAANSNKLIILFSYLAIKGIRLRILSLALRKEVLLCGLKLFRNLKKV